LTENNTYNKKQRWILGDSKAPKILRIAILVFSWIFAIGSIWVIMLMDAENRLGYNPIVMMIMLVILSFASYYWIFKKDLVFGNKYNEQPLELMPLFLSLAIFLLVMFRYTNNNLYHHLCGILLIGLCIISIYYELPRLRKINISETTKSVKQRWILETDTKNKIVHILLLILSCILAAGIIWFSNAAGIDLFSIPYTEGSGPSFYHPLIILIISLFIIIYFTIFKKEIDCILITALFLLFLLFLHFIYLYTNNDIYTYLQILLIIGFMITLISLPYFNIKILK